MTFTSHLPSAAGGFPVPFCTLLYFRCGTESDGLSQATGANKNWNKRTVSDKHFHAREAAAALLKMAKTTSNPDIVSGLVQAAADLKEQAGELPPSIDQERPTLREEG